MNEKVDQQTLERINLEVTEKLRSKKFYLSNLVSIRSSNVYIVFHNEFLYLDYRDGKAKLTMVFNELQWEKAMLSQDNLYIPLDTYLEPLKDLPFDLEDVFQKYDRAKETVTQLQNSQGKYLSLYAIKEYAFSYTFLPWMGFYRAGASGLPARFLPYISKYETPNLLAEDYKAMVKLVFEHYQFSNETPLLPLTDELRRLLYPKTAVLERVQKALGDFFQPNTMIQWVGKEDWFVVWFRENHQIITFQVEKATGKWKAEKFPREVALETLDARFIAPGDATGNLIQHPKYGLIDRAHLAEVDVPLLHQFTKAEDPEFWKSLLSFENISKNIQEKKVDLHFGERERSYSLLENKEVYHKYGNNPEPLEKHLRFVMAFDFFFFYEVE